jgi:hypothetical protein
MIGLVMSFIIQAPNQCTLERPYPWLPTSICTGYGISCPRSICKAAPGTPGQWDVNGRYTPKTG